MHPQIYSIKNVMPKNIYIINKVCNMNIKEHLHAEEDVVLRANSKALSDST